MLYMINHTEKYFPKLFSRIFMDNVNASIHEHSIFLNIQGFNKLGLPPVGSPVDSSAFDPWDYRSVSVPSLPLLWSSHVYCNVKHNELWAL